MVRFKTALCTFALLVSLATQVRAAEKQDVLKLVPSEAQAVLVIRDLAALSGEVAKIAETLEVTDPQFEDVLGQFKALTLVENGLDESGSLAIVMPFLPMGGGEPPFLVIVPVTDYAAFAGNFGVADAGEGVTGIELQGRPAFIKPVGGYAVISFLEPMLTNFVVPSNGGIAATTGTLNGHLIASSDAFVLVNLEQTGAMFGPMVASRLQQVKAQFALAQPEEAAKFGWTYDVGSSLVQAILRDAKSMAIGVEVSSAGFGFKTAMQFKEGSQLAQMFSSTPSGDLSFDRLPCKPFFFATSVDTSSLPLSQWGESFASFIPAEFPYRDLMVGSSNPMGITSSATQTAVYPPNLAGGGGLVNSVTVYTVAEPEKFLTDVQGAMTAVNTAQLPGGITVHAEYTPNATQVEGVTRVDSFRTKTQLPPEMVASMGPAGMFVSMMSEQSGYFIPAKGAVALVVGGDAATLKEVALAAAGNSGFATDDVLGVRGHLLPNRIAEVYVGVGALAKFANNYVATFVPQYTLELPATLTPIGAGVSSGDGGVATSFFVPIDVIVTAKKNIEKAEAVNRAAQGLDGPATAPETETEVH